MGNSNFKWISDGFFLWCSVLCCFRPFNDLIFFFLVVILKVYLAIQSSVFVVQILLLFFFFLWCLDLLPSISRCKLCICAILYFFFSMFCIVLNWLYMTLECKSTYSSKEWIKASRCLIQLNVWLLRRVVGLLQFHNNMDINTLSLSLPHLYTYIKSKLLKFPQFSTSAQLSFYLNYLVKT